MFDDFYSMEFTYGNKLAKGKTLLLNLIFRIKLRCLMWFLSNIFKGLGVEPIIFDENIFEKDALQLNISWKSADLGGTVEY